MKPIIALEGGITGACALTIVHELVRKGVPTAPRMDLLGMTALAKLLRNAGKKLPNDTKLFYITMAGDMVSNALYYALGGIGNDKNSVMRSTILGLSAGIGAVILPKPLGLNPSYSSRTVQTRIMTVAWYTLGGLVAGLAMKYFQRHQSV